MKISVIIPVGDEKAWAGCKASIERSVAAYTGNVEAEILPCFDLEHSGAYVARNEGLAKARGEWITWVDCDDFVEEEWFSTTHFSRRHSIEPICRPSRQTMFHACSSPA